MRTTLVVAVVLLTLAITPGGPVYAGEIESHFAAHLQTLGPTDYASAIVYLRDRPDVRALDATLHAQGASRSARHERVVTELRAAAGRSQPAFLAYLDAGKTAGAVEGYTAYWLLNLVVVSATRAELERIAQRPDVEAMEANFKAVLIEPVYELPLGGVLAGIGVTPSLRAINADRVWKELHITGAGRLIGGLDTGVDGSHPALTARWRGNSHPWQECWHDALGGGTTYPTDGNGHGTHTMGTMCGAGHATGDTVGVAFDAQWIADNSINQGVGSEFDNDVLRAFQWFTDPDGDPGTVDDVPDVVQNSWGIDSRFGGTYQDCDYRWQSAIENCEAAGVVVTFSAGNEGPGAQTLRSPATICKSPTTNFSVGAVDCENYGWPYPIASFSSRGPSDCDGVTIKPEVSGPGVNVYSSYPGGGYARMSGTSMAGPHVAGVVALMRQANPNADVATIKSILMSTARDEGSAGEDNTYGWGFIDAYAAVLAVMQPDTTPPTVTVTAPNGGEVLTAGSVYTVTWNASDDVGVSQTRLYYSHDGGASYQLVTTLSGNPGSYNWTVPSTPSTQCLVRVNAYDAAGNEGADVSDNFFTIQQPAGPYVWVNAVDLALSIKGSWGNAEATVLVWDQNNRPVSGARVYSHWAGLTGDSDVFLTKRNGKGTCKSDRVRNPLGCWDYYVDDVVLAGYTFRGDLGETHDQICVGAGLLAEASAEKASVALSLGQPARGAAEFSVRIPAETHLSLTIYDVAGRRIRTLVDEEAAAGTRTVVWDGTGDAGQRVPSGIYFCRLVAGEDVMTEKLMLVR